MPVSTSISKDIKRLAISGLLVLAFIILLIVCVYYILKCCFSPRKQSLIDREAELAHIREQQMRLQYGRVKQAQWKDAHGLEQVDEEGESYMTHYSDYRQSNPLAVDQMQMQQQQ